MRKGAAEVILLIISLGLSIIITSVDFIDRKKTEKRNVIKSECVIANENKCNLQ